MNRTLGIVGGAVFALLFAGTALGHSVTTTCGSVTFGNTTTGWTAVVQPGDLTFGPFTHDGDSGPYKMAAGSYSYQFVDAAGKNQESGAFTVAACATPSPSHHNPKPTPHATPPVTASAEYVAVSSAANPITIVLLAFGLILLTSTMLLVQRRTPADFPPYEDEPLEDSVDWPRLRRISRARREAEVTLEERQYGIPPRQGWAARHADGARHSEARRGGLR